MNSLINFKGVLSPIPTSFKKNSEDIDEIGTVNLLKFLKSNGIHGVFALGSYGSFPLLDPQIRKKAMQIISKHCKQLNLYCIMQIGAPGIYQAERYLDFAHQIDVDAVASVSPFYYSGHAYKWNEIFNYHKYLIQKCSLPYCIYNNPRTTSFTISPENLSNLIDAGASGLKDSGNDVTTFKKYLLISKNRQFNAMPGSGSTMLDCFLAGANAIVAGTSVAFPKQIMDLYNGIIQKKNQKELINLQELVNNCRSRQMSKIMRPAAAYLILREQGVDIGYPLPPWPIEE